MTRVIGEGGVVVPVTVIKAGPCVVLQLKNKKRDGYNAVQLGYADVKPHRTTKPMIGHAASAGSLPKRQLREVRLDGEADLSLGDVVTVEQFADGSVTYVDVVGKTKGCGFAGGMKRHGFGGKEATHGVKRRHRSPGSISGTGCGPLGRGVRKGQRMAGHDGDVRRTACSLKLVLADTERGLLLVRGSVPGCNGSLVFVSKAKKRG